MENGPGLEDGTIDVERLLVEPQDEHVSMDSVLCFNEKMPQNTVNMEEVSCSFGLSNAAISQEGECLLNGDVHSSMPSEVDDRYFRLQNDFCSIGDDYLLGVEFAESITNLEYGSIEGLRNSVSDSQMLVSNAGIDSPWKSELFRIMEKPECHDDQLKVSSSELSVIPSHQNESETLAEQKLLESHTLSTPRNSDKFHDNSTSSFQEILSDENVASPSTSVEKLCSPKTEKNDGCETKRAIAKVPAQASLTSALPTQKRSRKPTQRYIDELTDPISRHSKKRREVSSFSFKDKSLGVKDHKKCHMGSKAVRVLEEESSVKAIQVPFASLGHNECPKSPANDLVQSLHKGLATKSRDKRSTPDCQKKKDEYSHPKEKQDFVPAAIQKKRVDSVNAAHLQKRNDRIMSTSQKTRDDWILSVSPKKREHRVVAVSPKKREHHAVAVSPREREHRVVSVSQKKREVDEDNDFLDAESIEEVGARRKHHRLWTITEVRKLIDGVSQYGVGRWSRIKKLFFSASPHRTSVDLKDKWRNLLKASGVKEQVNRQGEKKRNFAWRPLPKSILRRVCELASMYPYPKGRKQLKIGNTIHHDSDHDSPDRSTDITLSDYRRILRSINGD